jgi:hypothetical protein
MRADEEFVSNSKQNFLEEVKRMRSGFVDIPVGGFKLSHLQEHPNLHVHGSPAVHFVQSDGELCVSKLLASVLHVLVRISRQVKISDIGKMKRHFGADYAFGYNEHGLMGK